MENIFYIFSLEDYSVRKRVTLPRNYESIDVCGMYSADGAYLYVPNSEIMKKEAYMGIGYANMRRSHIRALG